MKKTLVLLCLPITTFGQISGLNYHRVSFTLDSLLIIAKDTAKYLHEYEKLPSDSLMESEYFTAAKVYSRQKNYEKFHSTAKKSFEEGQTSEVMIDFNSSLPQKEKFSCLTSTWK